MTHIPNSMDELITHYGALITHVIRGTFRHHCSYEDRQDLYQDAVVRLIERDFLARCREYAATLPDYTFVRSLSALVKNHTLNFLRYRTAECRNVMREVSLRAALSHTTGDHEATEARVLARQRIERVRQHLMRQRRVIGRRPAIEVLDEALRGDGTLSKYALRRVKFYVEDLHV